MGSVLDNGRSWTRRINEVEEAVQPSLGCRNDMDMSSALHGSILDPMSRLCEAAARPGYYQGDLPEI